MSKNCLNCGSEHLDEANVCECGYRFASAGPDVAPQAPQANLTTPGWILTLLGIAVAIFAFGFFDPSVAAPYVPGDYMSAGSRIINSGLQQQQLMLFLAGCTMFVSGIVMLSAGALLDARKRA